MTCDTIRLVLLAVVMLRFMPSMFTFHSTWIVVIGFWYGLATDARTIRVVLIDSIVSLNSIKRERKDWRSLFGISQSDAN